MHPTQTAILATQHQDRLLAEARRHRLVRRAAGPSAPQRPSAPASATSRRPQPLQWLVRTLRTAV